MKNTIWVIWPIWSWKDTVWRYLEEKLWRTRYELSWILKKQSSDLWILHTRENLLEILQEKQIIYWKKYLSTEVLKLIEVNWIVTWIRMIDQIEELKK